MKIRQKKRMIRYSGIILFFILLLYSCLHDEFGVETYHENHIGRVFTRRTNKELTIEKARTWYESTQSPIVSTRSASTSFELLTKPNWRFSHESKKGKFEVVEVPLLIRGNAVLMDEETMMKYTEEENQKVRNISRMVIIKNIETGEIIHFIMHIIGSYSYLMNSRNFETNSYLYRTPDFDGSVLYYKPDGTLVNGWQYKSGKLVATITQGTREGMLAQKEMITRGWELQQDCQFVDKYVTYNDCEGFVYEDPEFGLGFGSNCTKKGHWETVRVCHDNWVYVEEPWYPSEGNENKGGGSGAGRGEDNGNHGGYIPQPTIGILTEELGKIIENNSNLTDTQLAKIADIISKIPENKGDFAIYSFLVNNGYKFKSVKISNSLAYYGANAGYQPESGTLVFASEENITYSTFVHEAFHLFQHKVNGEYKNEYRGLMEYERNLYMDIVFFVNEMKGDWNKYDLITNRTELWVYSGAKSEAQNDITDRYQNWLKKITKKGSKYPNIVDTEDFFHYAIFFGEVNQAYNVTNPNGYKYSKEIGYAPTALFKALILINNLNK